MAAASAKNLDRYILEVFLTRIKTVFGVEPYWSLRSDYSDAMAKINNDKSSRATERCFVRPTDFNFKRDGFRGHALGGRGMRAQPAHENANGQVSQYKVIHPIPMDTVYQVAFEVSTYTTLQRLWAVWANALVNASLDFIVEFEGLDFTINCEPSDSLSIPEFGEAGGQARDDVTRVEGTITVHGYTTSVGDPHEVPVILLTQVDHKFNLPD